MRVVIRSSIRILVLLFGIGRVAVAQDLLTISGVVTTRADGMPVPGAVVSIVGAAASATTDASGLRMNGRTIYARIGRRF
jgi:hypothetical protein